MMAQGQKHFEEVYSTLAKAKAKNYKFMQWLKFDSFAYSQFLWETPADLHVKIWAPCDKNQGL